MEFVHPQSSNHWFLFSYNMSDVLLELRKHVSVTLPSPDGVFQQLFLWKSQDKMLIIMYVSLHAVRSRNLTQLSLFLLRIAEWLVGQISEKKKRKKSEEFETPTILWYRGLHILYKIPWDFQSACFGRWFLKHMELLVTKARPSALQPLSEQRALQLAGYCSLFA